MPTREAAREVLDIYIRAWETQDPALIVTIFTPGATYHERVLGDPIPDREAIRAYWQVKVVEAQANIKCELLSMHMDGDTVIAEWEAHFDDLAQGVRKRMREIAVLEFEGNLIASLREYWASESLAGPTLAAAMPLPDPAARYDGPLTGIWLSAYEYESSSRGATYTTRHYVMVLQRGARLQVRSMPASASQMSMDLSANGQVVTGAWTEQTRADGYYAGAVYHGAIQMIQDPTGRRISGKWVGFGRDMTVNTGAWSLTLVDADVDEAAVERWNRDPE